MKHTGRHGFGRSVEYLLISSLTAGLALSGCGPGSAEETGVQWVKRIDGTIEQVVAERGGDVVVLGTFEGEVSFGGEPLSTVEPASFLARFDAEGTYLWSRKLGSHCREGSTARIAADSTGGVVVAGHFAGGADLGGGPLGKPGDCSFYMLDVDRTGQHAWSAVHQVAPIGEHAVAVDEPTGDIVIAMVHSGVICHKVAVLRFDASGEPLSIREGAQSVDAGAVAGLALEPNGGFLLAISDLDNDNVVVGDVDASGAWQWKEGLLGTPGGFGAGSDGHPIIATNTAGGPNHLASVSKFGNGGQEQWSWAPECAGECAFVRALDLAVDTSGDVVVVGNVREYLFVAKVSSQGELLWRRDYPDSSWGSPFSVAVDEQNDILVGGRFVGEVDLSNRLRPPASLQPSFLFKLSAEQP